MPRRNMLRSKSFLVVAAFDFGTTYSGYAYSYMHDPSKVYTNQIWCSGDASSKLITLKTPTSVLLDDTGEFHSFGFEAENHYAMLTEENRHMGWRLFRRFKMLLHNNKTLSRETTTEDFEGKSHPAMDIFVMAIKYLHGHLLKTIELRKVGMRETEIKYVITIPAIWEDGAKQFMREAAVKAGIDGDRLELAYESEVAAIWCTREEITDSPMLDLQRSGYKYIVIDLGGGTADITVHQRLQNGGFKVIHKASGGPWGGIYVDQQFVYFLENTFGKKVVEEFSKKHIGDHFEMIRGFENNKRSDNFLSNQFCTIRLPLMLFEIHRTMNANWTSYFMNNLFRWFYGALPVFKDKLRIASTDVKVWYQKVIDPLVTHIRELLNEERLLGIDTIVLVGGFAESTFLQDKLRKEFPEVNLIIPEEAGLAVLKGAVLYGHNPCIVESRVMAHTYGINIQETFDRTKHTAVIKKYVNKKWEVSGCFKIFVRANDVISIDNEVSHKTQPTAQISRINVYRTSAENPQYITDPGCELLGELRIKNRDNVPLQDQSHIVTFQFGQTELKVRVKDEETGDEEKLALECLN